MTARIALLVLATLLLGFGADDKSRAPSPAPTPEGNHAKEDPFPPQSELEALPPAPSLSDMFHSPAVEVPEWTLAGPFPN